MEDNKGSIFDSSPYKVYNGKTMSNGTQVQEEGERIGLRINKLVEIWQHTPSPRQ